MSTEYAKQVVLLPKNAVIDGKESRNPVLDLLTRAGYDKIKSGFDPSSRKPNREDQVQQGDFIFRAVKGADALAAQLELFRATSVGVVMGTDVLAEADLIARSYGIRSDIGRLLKLDIGACKLRFIVPQEWPVTRDNDIDGRLLFTKYPQILRAVLAATGRSAAIRRVEGADTRTNEYRAGSRNIGALEIVGSGDTARANRLQIVGEEFSYPSGAAMDVSYLSLANITTDLYATNISRVGGRSRDMLRVLGLALESARETNEFVAFTFNIPADQVDRFADLGMKGPSIMGVVTRDGSKWNALQVYAPKAQKNEMRALLMQRGAQDLSVGESLQVEVAADKSEVLTVLPFTTEVTAAVEKADRNAELVEWLTGLSGTIADRAAAPVAGSSTCEALQKGIRFCVDRYAVEMAELSKAVRQMNRAEIIAEAGQAVYWLLVAMQSRGIPLEDVINTIAPDEFDDVPDWRATDLQKLTGVIGGLRTAVRSGDMGSLNGMGYLLDQGLSSASVALVDKATELNTAFRKDNTQIAIAEAGEALKGLICLIELAGVDFDEVMDKERAT